MNNNLDLSAIPYVRLTKIDSRLLGIFNRILDLPGGGFFICKNGELTIGSNEKFYTLRKGDLYVFPADTKLLEIAVACCAECLPNVKVHTGRVVSGDVFVAKKEQKDLKPKIKSAIAVMKNNSEGTQSRIMEAEE